jgi:hypothetical protein
VELEGTLQLKSYRYKASKADDVGKEPTQATAPAGSPAATSAGSHP